MDANKYNEYCASLPATSHVIQWGGSHVWKVGEKVIAIGSWTKSKEFAVSLKVSDFNFDVLKDQPGFRPAPYLASRGMKWIQQYETLGDREDELRYYIKESHRIVSSGLSKKRRKELGLD